MSGSNRTAISEAAQRYGAALFDLATEAKKVAAVEQDAKALLAAWQTSADLRAALTSPLFPVEEKAAALAAIGKKMKVNAVTQKFLGLAAHNRRAADLGGMLAAFLALAAQARGAVLAEVSTAEPLSDEQLKSLTEALGRAFKAPVDVETTLKPELLGGLVVKVGSRLFDDSVKSKLDALKIAMKGA
ncbi:ATP synthase subunit delta [Candidatus Phycosocius bacilliformis]|uniref:ATP synthase subunit delta n=1 Tax=Candidatus Phycosocius bacilliformis TaxID=1445552 RepID=A0A2P2E613_9PROT|nr:F0F1 ATP synthase subunit delta [Candidatus Phycosocius bacilliformis]GBF56497.1 ATP synthase subunit delta [Candidatus Phycosocius bacilliformis]